MRFKNAIYRLRHAMGTESVTLIEEEYRFNRTLDYDYDVENFLQEIALRPRDERSIDKNAPIYSMQWQYIKDLILPKVDYDWVLIQTGKPPSKISLQLH